MTHRMMDKIRDEKQTEIEKRGQGMLKEWWI